MLLRSAPPKNMPKMPGGWSLWRIKIGCVLVLAAVYGGFVWYTAHQKIPPQLIHIPVMVIRPAPPKAPPAPPIQMQQPAAPPAFPVPNLRAGRG
ncbi:hypothetical protein K2X14_00820 [Acetobacter sp. TBRC 12305]|uniref:Uncharacterized protein n=1 Tax=Acetobacter garciniae TaxID=2817435 RepID=A0A939KQI9_9PROT|nr:hypothetical protein [Acetobacter garciniae]MBO1323696.1 hypothetical protein [Acetobacter garciniae]MBX0343385.1 hypothetical protein [Acetobacter garciniae]